MARTISGAPRKALPKFRDRSQRIPGGIRIDFDACKDPIAYGRMMETALLLNHLPPFDFVLVVDKEVVGLPEGSMVGIGEVLPEDGGVTLYLRPNGSPFRECTLIRNAETTNYPLLKGQLAERGFNSRPHVVNKGDVRYTTIGSESADREEDGRGQVTTGQLLPVPPLENQTLSAGVALQPSVSSHLSVPRFLPVPDTGKIRKKRRKKGELKPDHLLPVANKEEVLVLQKIEDALGKDSEKVLKTKVYEFIRIARGLGHLKSKPEHYAPMIGALQRRGVLRKTEADKYNYLVDRGLLVRCKNGEQLPSAVVGWSRKQRNPVETGKSGSAVSASDGATASQGQPSVSPTGEQIGIDANATPAMFSKLALIAPEYRAIKGLLDGFASEFLDLQERREKLFEDIRDVAERRRELLASVGLNSFLSQRGIEQLDQLLVDIKELKQGESERADDAQA